MNYSQQFYNEYRHSPSDLDSNSNTEYDKIPKDDTSLKKMQD